MLSSEVEVAIDPDTPFMRRMRKHLQDPAQQERGFRSPENAESYKNYLRNGGVGIRIGLSINIFPYDLLLNMLDQSTNLNWIHYVYASLYEVSMLELTEVVNKGFDQPKEYILFINPPKLQSQRQLPHGHILTPARATIMI